MGAEGDPWAGAAGRDLVRRLLAEQHPDLAGEAQVRVGEGLDNVMFRLGSELAVRLPRRAEAVQLLLNEQRWLPALADRLAVETPRPVRIGRPSPLFPWPWSVVRWIDGSSADVEPLGSGQGERLGGLLRELHRPAPAEAPENPYRGVPLRARAEPPEERWAELEASGFQGVDALRSFWTLGRAAPEAEERVWLHGDLHPRNAVVRGGELVGLVDWGDLTGGDPATDLASAWTLLRSDEERRRLWDRYGRSEPLWLRARAWAVLFGTWFCTRTDAGYAEVGRPILDALTGSAG